MSRRCEVCAERGKRRLMKDHLRHVHELEPGTAFSFPMTGDVSRLVALSSGRAEIVDPKPDEEVQFETFDGQAVSFTRTGSKTEPCSPTAQVEPLVAQGGPDDAA